MLEKIIAKAWQNALQIGKIGVYDNYFELGGDSVKAIKIVSELDKSGIKLTIGEIFSNPVLKNLAEHINNSSEISQVSLEEKFKNEEVFIETAKKDSKAINSSKELKIVVQEDIRVYLSHALPLCAILADESVRPWFYEHYINIFSMVDEDGYYTADFLEYVIPYKDIAYSVQFGYSFFVNERSNIVEFTIEQLENDYYMIIHFDEYYITDKKNYMRNHFVRHSLIYGYDNDKKLFSAIGFNASGMFGKIHISYDDFRKGFENGIIHYRESAVWCEENAVEMIKHGRTRGQYPFDISKFMGELNNYIESKEDFTKVFCVWSERKDIDRNKLSYGISVYDSLIEHISNMSPEKITVDYRTFHLLYEQKNSIYVRIKYVAECQVSNRELGELAERYRAEVVDGFNKLRVRMLNLEYSFKLSKDSFDASESWKASEVMCSAMLSIRDKELDIIRKILKLLAD
jgi:aryl carrier-like protein